MGVGALTSGAVAGLPSPPKVDPPPAMMDICPAGVIITIRLLLVSATYVFKAASIAQPWGPFTRDCQPLAGRASEPPPPMIPPMVMMMPVLRFTCRTGLFPVSAIQRKL